MKKSVITPTGTKSVLIPLLPILWVRHLSDGTAVATFALVRLLSAHLFNNWRHETENHKAWLPVHSVGSWTLQSHLHITSHWQTMDCYHKWHASHWRYKELRRTESKGSELFKKGMQVMEAVSIIIVGLMTAMWLFIIVGLVCCHVHQLQERKRLRRTHASYFKQ